ncbi:hypothetical protein [Mesorhizobium sp. M0578]|uniref:hypothetical protein n=1 Tax=unclassified Mesorhizobium TaxID=325217 RepID=UPI003334D992
MENLDTASQSYRSIVRELGFQAFAIRRIPDRVLGKAARAQACTGHGCLVRQKSRQRSSFNVGKGRQQGREEADLENRELPAQAFENGIIARKLA